MQVKIDGDNVLLRADKKSLENFRRAPIACSSEPEQDPRVFLIVGGGECGGREVGRVGGGECGGWRRVAIM